jgi:hypothetical protein
MDTTTNNARSSLPAEISVTELKALMNSSLEPGVDFVVVDVRRTDLDVRATSRSRDALG